MQDPPSAYDQTYILVPPGPQPVRRTLSVTTH